ncbi:MAG: hypothetical protein WDA16_11975 [Candidatus Thermoplasmatota archaeon]
MRQVALVALAVSLIALPPIPIVAADDCASGCVSIPSPVGMFYLNYFESYAGWPICPHGGPKNCRAIGLLWQETNTVSGLQMTRDYLWKTDTLVIL